jgi:hypothetical protein
MKPPVETPGVFRCGGWQWSCLSRYGATSARRHADTRRRECLRLRYEGAQGPLILGKLAKGWFSCRPQLAMHLLDHRTQYET